MTARLHFLTVIFTVIFAGISPLNAQTTQPTAPPQGEEVVGNPFPERVLAPQGILDGGKAWLNTSGPINLKDLRGKIVVIDFWTYCCINCIHVLPDLKYLEKKYPNELVVIGVHSAKFTNEKESENIRQAIMRYEIEHPVVNDADMTIWNKFGARSWPTLALIDPEGYYCGAQPGEGNRELFDAIVGRLVKHHRQKGTLDETPIQFNLEREKAQPTKLRFPGKVLADEKSQRLFVADTGHNRIVVSDMQGRVLHTIGNGAIGMRDGGFADAEFDHPQGMSLVEDQLYIADTENHSIRVADLSKKTVTTIAGTGKQSRRRTAGGPTNTTALNSPWALQHLDGILFIAMAGPHQIWQHVIGSDQISVYAGSGAEDVINGSLMQSALAQPSGLASDGNWLYVADSEGSAIRRIGTSADSEVTTIAGSSEFPRGQSLFEFGDVDAKGSRARFQHPLGVALQGDSLFVADSYNHKIRKVDLKSSDVTTWLGNGRPGKSDTQISEPGGLSITDSDLYIADTNNHRICRVSLAEKTLSEISFSNLSPPTPPKRGRFEDVKPTVIEAQSIRPGETLTVKIALDVPEGYKINREMPIVWEATNVDQQTAVVKDTKVQATTKAVDGLATVQIPLAADLQAGQLQLVVRYGYCRDGVGGLCKMTTKSWRIPLATSPDGKTELQIP